MRHALLICLSLCLFPLTGCPEDGTTDEAGSGGDGGAGGTAGDQATGGTGGDMATGGTGGDMATGGTGGDMATGGTGGDMATGGTGGDMATGGTGGAGGMGSSTGSCCEAHAEGGCVDAATEACVCGLNPDCCTAWDASCVLIVQQKYCEPGVRECVCGPASEGGWEQTQCCESNWSDLCSSTALIKCMGDPSCT